MATGDPIVTFHNNLKKLFPDQDFNTVEDFRKRISNPEWAQKFHTQFRPLIKKKGHDIGDWDTFQNQIGIEPVKKNDFSQESEVGSKESGLSGKPQSSEPSPSLTPSSKADDVGEPTRGFAATDSRDRSIAVVSDEDPEKAGALARAETFPGLNNTTPEEHYKKSFADEKDFEFRRKVMARNKVKEGEFKQEAIANLYADLNTLREDLVEKNLDKLTAQAKLRKQLDDLKDRNDEASISLRNELIKELNDVLADPDIQRLRFLESEMGRAQGLYDKSFEEFPELKEAESRVKARQALVDVLDRGSGPFDLSGRRVSWLANAGARALGSILGLPRTLQGVSQSGGAEPTVFDNLGFFADDLVQATAETLPKPSRLQKGVFEDGFNVDALFSKVADTTADLAVMVVGTKGIGAGLRGLSKGAAGKIGVTTTAFTQVQRSAFEEAFAQGLSADQAGVFAAEVGLAAGLISTLNPLEAGLAGYGRAAKETLTEVGVANLTKGFTAGEVMKGFLVSGTKNGLFEGAEEIAELAYENFLKAGLNRDAGVAFPMAGAEDFAETLVVAGIVGFIAGGGEVNVPQTHKRSLLAAINNPKKFEEITSQLLENEQITLVEKTEWDERINKLSQSVNSASRELTDDEKAEIAALEYGNQADKKRLEQPILDPERKKISDRIRQRNEQIESILFPEQKQEDAKEETPQEVATETQAPKETQSDAAQTPITKEEVVARQQNIPEATPEETVPADTETAPVEPAPEVAEGLPQEPPPPRTQRTKTPEQKPYRLVKEKGKFVVESDEKLSRAKQKEILKEERAQRAEDIINQQEDVSLENVTEDRATQEILENGSPVQIAGAFLAEPEIANEALIETDEDKIFNYIQNVKFTRSALAKFFNLSHSEFAPFLSKRRRKMGQIVEDGTKGAETDLSEMADQIGGVTEEQIADFLGEYVFGGKRYSKKNRKNPFRQLLKEKFIEKTGFDLDEDFANELLRLAPDVRLTERSDVLSGATERPTIRQEELTTSDYINRVLEDPRISDGVKSAIKNDDDPNFVLNLDDVNEVAEEYIRDSFDGWIYNEGLENIRNNMIPGIIKDAATPGKGIFQAKIEAGLAARMLDKIIFYYNNNGQHALAEEAAKQQAQLAGVSGLYLRAIQENAGPEAMVNRITTGILREQREFLNRKGVKGQTWAKLLTNLHNELKVTKAQVKSLKIKLSKRPKVQKAEIQQERKKIITDLKSAWQKYNSPGASWNMENEAKAQAELLGLVGKLIRNVAQEGVVELQEIAAKVLSMMKDAGISEKDAKPVIDKAMQQYNKVKDAEDEVRATIEDHYINSSDGTLEDKLAAVTGSKKFGREIAKDVQGQLAGNAKQWEAILNKMLNGELPPKTLKKVIPAVTKTLSSGLASNQDFIDIIAPFLGLTAINNAELNSARKLISDIQAAVSGEIKARKKKELYIKIKRMRGGFFRHLADELNTLGVLNALTGLNTQWNANFGAIATVLPNVARLAAGNPRAFAKGIKRAKFSFKQGTKNFWDAAVTNFTVFDGDGVFIDGKFESGGSIVEDSVLHGMGRYYNRMLKAGFTPKGALEATKLVGNILFMQPIRLAFLLKGLDAALTHPLSELVRFIEIYNKEAKDRGLTGIPNKFKNLGTEFLNEVDRKGGFDKESWDDATKQAEIEMMKMDDIPVGFQKRRAKEIILQKTGRDAHRRSVQWVKDALLLGEPSGLFTGWLYRGYQEKLQIRPEDKRAQAAIKFLTRATTGWFLRIAANSMNVMWKASPGGAIEFFGSAILKSPQIVSNLINGNPAMQDVNMMLKYVGNRRAKSAPPEMQVGGGWIRRSNSDLATIGLFHGLTAMAGYFLASAMFDFDDDEPKLNPNRLIDITGSQTGEYYSDLSTTANTPAFSIRFRKPDGTYTDGKEYRFFLHLVPMLAMLGSMRDQALFEPEKAKERGYLGMLWKAPAEAAAIMGELSFNSNAQTVNAIIDAAKRGGGRDDTSAMAEIGKQTIVQLGRPFRTIVQSNFSRDIMNEVKQYLGDPARRIDVDFGPDEDGLWGVVKETAETVTDGVLKGMTLAEAVIGKPKFDQFGYEVLPPSKTVEYLEMLPYVDIDAPFQRRIQNPEWKLVHKFPEVVDGGMWFPKKKYKVEDEVKEVSDTDRLLLQKEFAAINGKTIRDNIGVLNNMDAPQLQASLDAIRSFAADQARYNLGFREEEPDEAELAD